MRILLNHGQSERYIHKYVGINGRLDAIQAGILNVKLKYLDAEIAKRQEIAARYTSELKGVVRAKRRADGRLLPRAAAFARGV